MPYPRLVYGRQRLLVGTTKSCGVLCDTYSLSFVIVVGIRCSPQSRLIGFDVKLTVDKFID